MTAADSSRAAWRTSSHSGANGDCVEVARPAPDVIAVRDSRNPGGSRLAFSPGHWTAFTATLKQPGTVTAQLGTRHGRPPPGDDGTGAGSWKADGYFL